MPPASWLPYLPDPEKLTTEDGITYIDAPPDAMSCWYCGKLNSSYYINLHVVLYSCSCHQMLTSFLCVRTITRTKPMWYFDRMDIRYDKLRLRYHFYHHSKVSLEECVWDEDRRGEYWQKILSLPPETIDYAPEKLLKIFKMAKIFV